MSVRDCFHIETECQECGGKSHIVLHAQLPGARMRQYRIGEPLSAITLYYFKKRLGEYCSETDRKSEKKRETHKTDTPSFVIVPDDIGFYSCKCGQNAYKLSCVAVIEFGIFTKVMNSLDFSVPVMIGNHVFSHSELSDNNTKSELKERIAQRYMRPSCEPKPKPCPYCGNYLRTPKSKQCFHCHKDWHDLDNTIEHKPVEDDADRLMKLLESETRSTVEGDPDQAVRRALGLD